MNEKVTLTAADVGTLKIIDDPLAKTAADLDALLGDLVAQNQALGARIDAIRDQRRQLVRLIEEVQAKRALIVVARAHSSIDAVAPGATVVVTGREVLKAFAKEAG